MKRPLLWICALWLAGCASDGKPDPDPPSKPIEGADSSTEIDPEVRAYAQKLKADIADASKITADALEAKAKLPFSDALKYDPMTAQNLDLIQGSSLKLEQPELDVLGQRGFVISGRQRFPTFTYGYASIYAMDLPVYISADSIADALHRSYDEILMTLEARLLRVQLDLLLEDLQQNLKSKPASEARSDLDSYLAVARGLLSNNRQAQAGADRDQIDDLISKAEAAEGHETITLFGAERELDFSQFKPRGHYEDDPALQTYFRAMMWLGKVDFRLVETVDGARQVLNRPQVQAMLLLASLFDATDTERFHRVDGVVRAFVGESDNMTLTQIPDLLSALGIEDAGELDSVPDDVLRKTILEQGFGKQQILSDIMEGNPEQPAPLNASFLLFGQRYVVDSHVFSNVVWDRVHEYRMMPDPLDVAYAALGNDQAVSLLHDDLAKYKYSGNLAVMRTLVDEHGADFWHANLYNDWLSALRALSPVRANMTQPPPGMPSITASEAWGRRVLNTQLASWAQLRHDTLLYAKQSYTGSATCHFPDASIDPYPEFYAAVGRFADHGYALADLTENTDATDLGDRMRDYFGQMRDVAHTLEAMAKAELAGDELSADQLAFINDAVVINRVPAGCTKVEEAAGWYTRLFFDQAKALEYDPTIADVHTQPTDAGGNDVGRILHVATAEPRLMIVTEDGCDAPRAYAGLASSYYEQITENWERVTDSEWQEQLQSSGPPDAPRWVKDLVPIGK
jgi:hypothetical protein